MAGNCLQLPTLVSNFLHLSPKSHGVHGETMGSEKIHGFWDFAWVQRFRYQNIAIRLSGASLRSHVDPLYKI